MLGHAALLQKFPGGSWSHWAKVGWSRLRIWPPKNKSKCVTVSAKSVGLEDYVEMFNIVRLKRSHHFKMNFLYKTHPACWLKYQAWATQRIECMKQRQTNTIARLSNRCIVIFMVGRKYKPSPWVLSFPMPSLGCQNALVDGALHSLPDQCDRSTSELNVQDRCTEVSSTYAPIHSAYSAMPNSHILANSCQTNKEVACLNHPFSVFVQLVVVKKLPGLPRHGLPCYPIDPVRGREPCQLVQDTQKKQSFTRFTTAGHALSPPAGWTWIPAKWLLSVWNPLDRKTMWLTLRTWTWCRIPQQRSAWLVQRFPNMKPLLQKDMKPNMIQWYIIKPCLQSALQTKIRQSRSHRREPEVHFTKHARWNNENPATSWENLYCSHLDRGKDRNLHIPIVWQFHSRLTHNLIGLASTDKSEMEESKILGRVDQKEQGAFP